MARIETQIDIRGASASEVTAALGSLPDVRIQTSVRGDLPEFITGSLNIMLFDDPGDMFASIESVESADEALPVLDALAKALPSASLDLTDVDSGEVLAIRRPQRAAV